MTNQFFVLLGVCDNKFMDSNILSVRHPADTTFIHTKAILFGPVLQISSHVLKRYIKSFNKNMDVRKYHSGFDLAHLGNFVS